MVSEIPVIATPTPRTTLRIITYQVTVSFLVALAWFLGPGTPTAKAQDPLESIGIHPFSAQLPVENGYINLANGDLHLEIPLGTFPQRGGVQDKVALTYDSAIWTQAGGGWSPTNVPVADGWQFVNSEGPTNVSAISVQNFGLCTKDHQPNWITSKGYSWTAPDGAAHLFPITITVGLRNQCGDYTSKNQLTGDAIASDATGFHMYIALPSYKVVAPDGTIVFASLHSTISLPKDTNGNYFTVDSNNNVVDTLGRTPVTTTTNGNTITYAVLNSKGGTSNYTVTTESINVWTNFASAGSGLPDFKGSITVIQSILLPDGTTYSFGYDSGTTQGHYGQLTSMTLPTGGQITYSYLNFDDSMSNPFGKHVTRGISNRTTPDGMWAYSPSVITQCTPQGQVGCQQSMTVTKPSGDQSVYTFTLNGGAWPIEAQYYSGPVSPANLLATLTQTFDYSQGCPQATSSCLMGQAGYVTKTGATVTLPLPGGTSINQTTKYTWDTTTNFGNLTQKSEWNFYSGSLPASADRTTAFAYLNGSSYIANNILNRPTTVTVTDKNGATVSKTINSYDASISSVTGITHHDDTNYGSGNTVRGNLTQIQRLVSGTSNYLTTSKTYDTTGSVPSSMDSNSNPTTYNYGDNFFTDAGDGSNPVAFTPSAPTNAFPKTVTQGSLVSTLGYYWGKGQKALSTDPTSQTTYFHFYDPLDRPTSTKLPDGGWTYSVYPSGSETQVDTGTGITSTTLTTTQRVQLLAGTIRVCSTGWAVSHPRFSSVIQLLR